MPSKLIIHIVNPAKIIECQPILNRNRASQHDNPWLVFVAREVVYYNSIVRTLINKIDKIPTEGYKSGHQVIFFKMFRKVCVRLTGYHESGKGKWVMAWISRLN